MKVAIVNLGQIVSGDWRKPFAEGDTILTDGETHRLGRHRIRGMTEAADVVIDAGGMTAIPGLIDSHVHITFGDYTPRQRTVGYLESYLHGGTTTAISASEVHVPGRPRDVEGVKALAVAAQRCFADYRPGGMRVIAGSVILEPGLNESDFLELAQKGVRLAKAGFGAVKTAYDYVPLVADAKAAGLITTCHTGGSSIPGSGAITGDHLLKMHPHVSFHINGGPTAMPDADFERVITEIDDGAAGLHRRQPAHDAPVRKAGRGKGRVRSLHHRDRHANRQRHHAARHALHHRAPGEPDRHAAGAFHLRGDWQQCACLWPRQRTAGARQGRRHRADRCARRRHAEDRAGRHQAWRYRCDRRGRDRRRAAVRRPQPQHAGDDAQGARRALARHAGFLRQRRIDHAGRANIRNTSRAPRWGQETTAPA